jgi:hypothetical protein
LVAAPADGALDRQHKQPDHRLEKAEKASRLHVTSSMATATSKTATSRDKVRAHRDRLGRRGCDQYRSGFPTSARGRSLERLGANPGSLPQVRSKPKNRHSSRRVDHRVPIHNSFGGRSTHPTRGRSHSTEWIDRRQPGDG